jgi:hypothetical protein
MTSYEIRLVARFGGYGGDTRPVLWIARRLSGLTRTSRFGRARVRWLLTMACRAIVAGVRSGLRFDLASESLSAWASVRDAMPARMTVGPPMFARTGSAHVT